MPPKSKDIRTYWDQIELLPLKGPCRIGEFSTTYIPDIDRSDEDEEMQTEE